MGNLDVTFTFIRHGESIGNVTIDTIQGRSHAIPLTEKGLGQATALGRYFARENVIFDAAYASMAVRTHLTAQRCFEEMGCQLPVIYDERLDELDLGDWVGMSRNIYQRPDVRAALDRDSWNFIPGTDLKGESQKMAADRMISWINDKLHEAEKTGNSQHIAVFSHGNAIKFFVAELLDLDRTTAFQLPIENTSITQLCYRGQQLVLPLAKFNFIEHLELKH